MEGDGTRMWTRDENDIAMPVARSITISRDGPLRVGQLVRVPGQAVLAPNRDR